MKLTPLDCLRNSRKCSVSTENRCRQALLIDRRAYNVFPAITLAHAHAMSFEDYEPFTFDADGVGIAGMKGGDGPPLLLLHGHPQTHEIWHRLAPVLAQYFTVVAADLRGCGASG